MDRLDGQSGGSVAARDFTAQHSAYGAMHVADNEAAGDRCSGFKGRRGLLNENVIERLVKAVILCLNFAVRHARRQRRRVED